MIKTAFYIKNKNIVDVDCSDLINGNPGIGGSEYLFYFTTYNLQRLNQSETSITLLTSSNAKLPKDLNYVVVGKKENAIGYCLGQGYDILVVKYEESDYLSGLFSILGNEISLKIVVWAHNIIPNHILNRMEQIECITAIVNVGREQLDLYRDHNMFYKSTYIYNSLPIKSYSYYEQHSIPFKEREHEVTYLGSLIPVKGFHVLAKAWKEILRKVPDAHLNVIGTGKVYNTKTKLGAYGIAEESYEREFMPYLTDENGKILDSVTFYGKLGKEKATILGQTKVGVPNPVGTSETFCLSAVEMALYGARIVAKKYVGMIDTVNPDIGVFFKTEKSLSKFIVQELERSRNLQKQAWTFLYQNFSQETIAYQWLSFLKELADKGYYRQHILPVNSTYNLKQIRELNRIIKSILPLGRNLPTVDFYLSIICKIFRIKSSTPIIKF